MAPTSPVRGKAVAKSGTTIAGDGMNQRPLTMVRALAGYLTAKSGRELIFTIYVSDVPLAGTLEILTVIKEQGSIAEGATDVPVSERTCMRRSRPKWSALHRLCCAEENDNRSGTGKEAA